MSLYKASIFRHGAEIEDVYGTEPEFVLGRALKMLHTPLPSSEPKCVVLYEKTDGNSGIWKTLRTVEYEPHSAPGPQPGSPRPGDGAGLRSKQRAHDREGDRGSGGKGHGGEGAEGHHVRSVEHDATPKDRVCRRGSAHPATGLRIIKDLKLMCRTLEVIETQIRKHPEMFECGTDYVLMKVMADRCQSGAIGVNDAISWAHTKKYGAPQQPPLPEPRPEFDYCPHCKGSYSFTKLIGNNCPHCGKIVREPNAFVELMRGNPPAHQEVLSDIDATE